MKGRIRIKEYSNCINIEVRAKKQPVKISVVIILFVLWGVLFAAARKMALVLPWSAIAMGMIMYILWLFLEKTTISVFPEYIMVVRNYFLLDIAGKFYQRDAVSGLRKAGDYKAIVFEYLHRPEILISGLSPEETAFIMKFLVFRLGKPEFKRMKK